VRGLSKQGGCATGDSSRYIRSPRRSTNCTGLCPRRLRARPTLSTWGNVESQAASRVAIKTRPFPRSEVSTLGSVGFAWTSSCDRALGIASKTGGGSTSRSHGTPYAASWWPGWIPIFDRLHDPLAFGKVTFGPARGPRSVRIQLHQPVESTTGRTAARIAIAITCRAWSVRICHGGLSSHNDRARKSTRGSPARPNATCRQSRTWDVAIVLRPNES